jgi:HEAT repeat protein
VLAVTPADELGARAFDPFCSTGVLSAINDLAEGTHSKALADLITAGKHRAELLMTLGKVGAPRYANFIGRYKDDPDLDVRRGVAIALGLMDNDAVTVPVLVQLLARGTVAAAFAVKWDAAESLVNLAKRKGGEGVRQRVGGLLQEPDGVTVALAARALVLVGDARGTERLRQLTAHADPRVRQEALMALGETRDAGGREAVTRRLKDDHLAVRACAVYALGRIAGAAAAAQLRTAVQEALDYERQIDARRQRGESEATLRERYGLGVFDLRETLQQALAP